MVPYQWYPTNGTLPMVPYQWYPTNGRLLIINYQWSSTNSHPKRSPTNNQLPMVTSQLSATNKFRQIWSRCTWHRRVYSLDFGLRLLRLGREESKFGNVAGRMAAGIEITKFGWNQIKIQIFGSLRQKVSQIFIHIINRAIIKFCFWAVCATKFVHCQ